jgi:hypothetical protein
MAAELTKVGEFVVSAFCQLFGAVSPGSGGQFRETSSQGGMSSHSVTANVYRPPSSTVACHFASIQNNNANYRSLPV